MRRNKSNKKLRNTRKKQGGKKLKNVRKKRGGKKLKNTRKKRGGKKRTKSRTLGGIWFGGLIKWNKIRNRFNKNYLKNKK
tara:strand:- start:1346 stop:1585 length:240 start_codon:yes stop_codon:yes gene_type:complete